MRTQNINQCGIVTSPVGESGVLHNPKCLSAVPCAQMHMLIKKHAYCSCCWRQCNSISLIRDVFHPPASHLLLIRMIIFMTYPAWFTDWEHYYTHRYVQPCSSSSSSSSSVKYQCIFSYAVKQACWGGRQLWSKDKCRCCWCGRFRWPRLWKGMGDDTWIGLVYVKPQTHSWLIKSLKTIHLHCMPYFAPRREVDTP